MASSVDMKVLARHVMKGGDTPKILKDLCFWQKPVMQQVVVRALVSVGHSHFRQQCEKNDLHFR